MRIQGNSRTKSRNGIGLEGFAGSRWLESCSAQWNDAINRPEQHVVLDLSNVSFVGLYEWTTTVSLIEKVLSRLKVQNFTIDFLGRSGRKIIPREAFDDFSRSGSRGQYSEDDFVFSEKSYRLAGFIESLDTYRALNRSGSDNRFSYSGISLSDARSKAYYSNLEDKTVVLGLTRVAERDDCALFLDESRIHAWRSEMENRFPKSPLFMSEEIWRVLCHELSANIWEHAGETGFISARVISKPLDSQGRLLAMWKSTWSDYGNQSFLERPFLELCVADAGPGFKATLTESFLRQNEGVTPPIVTEELLAFAFDETGTSKSELDFALTQRHALGRILYLVSKYGGALSLLTCSPN